MTRHDNRDRIGAERIADRAGSAWSSHLERDLAVGRHDAIWDSRGAPEHPPCERAGRATNRAARRNRGACRRSTGPAPGARGRDGAAPRGSAATGCSATSAKTSSRFSLSKAIRTSPLGVAISSRVPTGLSMVVTATSTSPLASARCEESVGHGLVDGHRSSLLSFFSPSCTLWRAESWVVDIVAAISG